MKCPKCQSQLAIKVGTRIDIKGAKVITAFITVLTLQCEKCNHVFQAPVESKSIFSVKKDPEKDN